MATFRMVSEFEPQGDQPAAITALTAGIEENRAEQCLLGVTGSGKTFTMAKVVQNLNRPTLVLAPNKTLAAQLYTEFKEFFPDNAVEYFVSYYDYYQPEAYVPSTDTYIAKDAKINDEIDRLRHSATRSLFERRDVLIVASVSCIYGIGSAEAYYDMLVHLRVGEEVDRDRVARKLVEIQYERNNYEFSRGLFRVRGDVMEIFPAHEDAQAIRVEWFGDEVERIAEIDPLRGRVIRDLDQIAIFPNSHYVTNPENMKRAIADIHAELKLNLADLNARGKLLEAQRLEQRTRYDLEILEQIGHCKGIENYSRHLTGRSPGEPPPTLLDYFPEDYLFFIDESHVAVPQIGGMYRGDHSRKSTLVSHGFRLPSAMDNRPLKFDEFKERVGKLVYVSATPGDYEFEQTEGEVVEMIVRPTGLLDPKVEVRPIETQVDDLLEEIRARALVNERVLVTTLTKRMAEDLTEYYREMGVKVCYLHSDIDTLERIEIIRELRAGRYDVLVGINLLREGLDIPEVSLVAILDADKEGFLRSKRSLIQTFGRAARHLEGRVILYAQKITGAMQTAIEETERRRVVQEEHNQEHGIIPRSVSRPIHGVDYVVGAKDEPDSAAVAALDVLKDDDSDIYDAIERWRAEMLDAAKKEEFERAAQLRDQIRALEKSSLMLG